MVADVYAQIGSEIRRRREGLGLSQAQLADRIGVGRTSVTMIERGAQAILVHQLLEIAKALRVSPEILLSKAEMVTNVGLAMGTDHSAKVMELLSELEPMRRITR